MNLIQRTLTYWYGQWPYNSEIASKKSATWFASTPETDLEIKSQFNSDIEQLLKQYTNTSKLDLSLPAQIDEALAHILLLDQFTRNIHRGSKDAFSGDPFALSLCLHLLDHNVIKTLPLDVAAFACMPLQHSEDPDIQLLSVETFQKLHTQHGDVAKGYSEFARIHKDIIDEFGRYPHRNEALGRTPTDAELTYLKGDGHRFGQ